MRVHVLATGGTIAGTAASQAAQGYRSAGLGVSTLVDGVPGLRDVAALTGEQFSQVGPPPR
ncbi:MAG TPA: asparaginase domain-containing protein [Microbacterium sp.]|nr:asparaginase domain-containing protein [Microbacterium sp.]